jgi:hypothetical protein
MPDIKRCQGRHCCEGRAESDTGCCVDHVVAEALRFALQHQFFKADQSRCRQRCRYYKLFINFDLLFGIMAICTLESSNVVVFIVPPFFVYHSYYY